MKTKILIVLSFILLCICTPVRALAGDGDAVKLDVESVATEAGTTKDVDISIKNNPGILGCKLTLKYDSRLVLKSASAGDAFSALTMTKPGVLENSCSFVWDAVELDSKDIKDGVILKLTFDVPAGAKDKDNYSVEVICEDAVDKDLATVSVVTGSGQITVENKSTTGILDKITAYKTKTSYTVGDKLNVDDIAVTAVYADGTKKTVSDYSTNVSSIDMSTVGKKTLIVSYTEDGVTKKADIDIQVKAVESVSNAKLIVSNNVSLPGDTIDVDIAISNNPGILGMSLTLQYDAKLKLVSAKSGPVFDMLAMTSPGIFESGCKFVWDGTELDEKSIKDGTILTLTFEISKEAKAGEKYIISALTEDAVDYNLNPVKIAIQSGSLSIGDDSSVVDNSLVGINATKQTVKYEKGSTLDLSDLVVEAEYNGGLYKKVTDYTTNAASIDMNVIGEKILIITYSDQGTTKSTEIKINVVDKRDNHENHNKYSLVEEVPATCVKDGTKEYYICDDCGRMFEDNAGKKEIEKPVVIPKTGHAYVNVVTKATLNNNGYTVKQCTKCKDETDKTVIYRPKTIDLSKGTFSYTGKNQKPDVVIKDENGKIISKTNFDIAYDKNCKTIGKHKVKVTFKGNYTGSIEKYYTIIPASTKIKGLTNTSSGIKLTWNKAQCDGYKIYRSINGKGLKLVKSITKLSTVSWIDSSAKTNGYKYTYVVCPYKKVNGEVYKSSMKEIKRCTYISVEKITGIKNQSSGKMSVKWIKNTKATGYQVQYSTRKSFSSAVMKTYRKKNVVSASYGKLRKGTTYYVRVRAYNKGTSTVYGAWSSVKKIKIAK
ncbi:MAG: bacterial Ig-like domain-containing protein [Clostridiales bacterium]|nr:bacterial Ig-like domain-containing protein [Clostridiales bacterium]